MADTQLTLGEKIKNFRKRAGLSQMELETAIGAANGSVSRIESGQVNPTKETILQLAKVLKLNEKELSDLLGVKPLLPTRIEVDKALEECKTYLDNEEIIAYLVDENGVVYYISLGFKNLLSLTEEQVEKAIGKEILEIVLDPQLGISDSLDLERNKKTIAIELVRISMESNIAEEYLSEVLSKFPLASEIFSLAKNITISEVLAPLNKKAYFRINGDQIQYSYSQEKLKKNQRFELVEYFSPVSYN